jgi:hypothetical protein
MPTSRPKARGRQPKRVYINMAVLEKTRAALTFLKKVTGLRTQADVLDYMVADIMRRQPSTVRKQRSDKGKKRGPRS